MKRDYDVIVLGGGPGGYMAAIRCAQYGLKTALIEERELGGTCLNRGCIPTKALIQGAEVYQTVKEASMYGVQVGEPTLDYLKLTAFKDRKVASLRRGIESLERKHGVQVIKGHGQLADRNTLSVDGSAMTADRIILATGSIPASPPIEGIGGDNVLTSDGILALTELPESVVIVGGGVIGVEFAGMLSSLSCRVNIIEMLPDILPGVDTLIREELKTVLKAAGIVIHTNAKLLSIHGNKGIFETKGKKESVSGEKFLICVGRRPNTEDIGLEATGIAIEKGYIKVNPRMQTSVENIFAVGDIIGGPQYAHAASAQGLAAAAACAGREDDPYGASPVPGCIYTNPEIAFVGLTQEEAVKAGHSVKVGSFPVSANGRSSLMNESQGFARIVTDEETGEILGAQIMSPRATDLIGEITAVMRCEGTIAELASTIHPHPTVSEIIMESAQDVLGLCCHANPAGKPL